MNNERRLNMSEEEARKRIRELLNLPKEDLLTQYLFLEQENQALKKQIEDLQEKIILLKASKPMLKYKKLLEENQQKQFLALHHQHHTNLINFLNIL